jgi:hypothetical protein
VGCDEPTWILGITKEPKAPPITHGGCGSVARSLRRSVRSGPAADGAMIASSTTAPSADRIQAILDQLTFQRRAMKRTNTEAGLLEANRLAILYWQWQLRSGREKAPR